MQGTIYRRTFTCVCRMVREALVEIANLAVLSGRIARRELAAALEWATENRALLSAKWEELNP